MYLLKGRKSLRLWTEGNQNYHQDMKNVFQHNIQQISRYSEDNQMKSKKILWLAKKAFHSSEFRLKIERKQ